MLRRYADRVRPQYDNGWFKMKTPDGDRVIMPVKLLDELKDAPRETLSFHKASSDVSPAVPL